MGVDLILFCDFYGGNLVVVVRVGVIDVSIERCKSNNLFFFLNCENDFVLAFFCFLRGEGSGMVRLRRNNKFWYLDSIF